MCKKKFELLKIRLMENLNNLNRQKKFEIPRILFYIKTQILHFIILFIYIFTNSKKILCNE
jgi:hypothetical protein